MLDECLRLALDEIARVSALIETGSAKKWAVRIRTESAEEDSDPVVPSAWREAWNWRRAVMFLDKIDGHHKAVALDPNACSVLRELENRLS